MKQSIDIQYAHFQLTGHCNLHCSFCGQSKGMLASKDRELPVKTWLDAAQQFVELTKPSGVRPTITLWGGEPLLYPAFDELTRALHQMDITLQLITNGTLLNEHLEVIRECINTLFVSVDGTRNSHDAVRGAGTFDRLRRNLGLLAGHKGRLIFLTTLSEANLAELHKLPKQFAALHPTSIIFQPLMYLSQAEIDDYRAYSKKNFGCDYPELDAWLRNDDADYLKKLNAALDALKKAPASTPYSITLHQHQTPDVPVDPCSAPWHRIHIRHDGEVGFCTDYFGFSAGNITKTPLKDIVFSDRAELFRKAVEKAALPTCRHCPWHKQYI